MPAIIVVVVVVVVAGSMEFNESVRFKNEWQVASS